MAVLRVALLLDGKPVSLKAPKKPGPAKKARTASGSVAVDNVRAKVARASRIYVEGRHDAELVEKVWGDDLRIEGVVVEYLEGRGPMTPGSVGRRDLLTAFAL